MSSNPLSSSSSMATQKAEMIGDQSLANKVAIVTGSSRGIGAGIALELGMRGAKVTITYTSPSSEKLADDLASKIESLQNEASAIKVKVDLGDPEAPKQVVSATTKAFGDHIDILVNNAGIENVKGLEDITPQDFNDVFNVNVRGPLLMTQAVLPYLRKPGRIINISSVAARFGLEKLSIYSSSKAALEGLTRSLATELGGAGHTVNAVEPGPIEGEMILKIPPEIVQRQKETTPVERRLGKNEDVADIVAFLAEERSRWLSGQTISASGGWSMV